MVPSRYELVWQWLERAELGPARRIPPERELAETLGLSRAELRKSLGDLEAQGLISRHVGRGTFLTGPQPADAKPSPAAAPAAKPVPSPPPAGAAASAQPRREIPAAPPAPAQSQLALPFGPPVEVSRAEIAEARLALEPRLASLAAIHAARSDLAEIRRAEADLLLAPERGTSLAADKRLHRAIALASRNRALIHLWEEWARLAEDAPVKPGRDEADLRARGPAADEHRQIVQAILQGNREGAEAAARAHILREESAFLEPAF